MKVLVLVLALVSFSAFSEEAAKKVVTEHTETTVKKAACPMVNGKEDCTAKEVKTKVIEIKKKL